jgi:hypothetical protein
VFIGYCIYESANDMWRMTAAIVAVSKPSLFDARAHE